jgi:hypothetical protein
MTHIQVRNFSPTVSQHCELCAEHFSFTSLIHRMTHINSPKAFQICVETFRRLKPQKDAVNLKETCF